MNRIDRLLAGLLWLLGLLFVAGIVHIVTIFALPDFKSKDAFERFSLLAQPARLTLLPHPQPGAEIMPYGDPAVAQGICLFDLSQSAFRLHGEVDSDRLLSLSFRTPEGHVFYSMTDRAAQHGKIDVLVLTTAQLETVEAEANDEDEPPQELRLLSPTRKGIVFVSALASLPSERPEAEERVKAISCEAEQIPQEQSE